MKNTKLNIVYSRENNYFTLKIDNKKLLDSNANIIKIKDKKELNSVLDFIKEYNNIEVLSKSYAFKLLQIKYGINNKLRKDYIN